MSRGEYERILTISHLERLRNTRYGNPRFRVFFTDGSIAELQRDSSYGYEIENPAHGRGTRSDGTAPNLPLVVTFTAAGNVAHARIAEPIDYIGAPSESPVIEPAPAFTKSLPLNGFYRAMRSGHLNRYGHALEARMISTDGELWTLERSCCE